MQAKPARAAIYCRVSQDRSGEALGVDRQAALCEDKARSLGWVVAARYVDNDTSASRGSRPAYQRMLQDIRDDKVDGIVAWQFDRLWRQPAQLEELLVLVEAKRTQIHVVVSGDVDPATSTGRLVARLFGAFARREVEQLAERTTAGKADAKRRGGYTGGPAPFGYRVVPLVMRADGRPLEVVPEAAEALQEAAAHLLSGGSLRQAARRLAQRGVRTSRGSVLDGTGLRKALTNPSTAARADVNGEFVPTSWEPLLDYETWLALRDLFSDPSRRTTASYERRWLLSGIAKCGVCGTPLSANTTAGGGPGGRQAAYRCRALPLGGGAAHVTRSAALVDQYVTDLTVRRLSRPDALSLFAPAEVDVRPLLDRRALLLRQRQRDLDAYSLEAFSPAEFSQRSEQHRRGLAKVEAELAAAAAVRELEPLVGLEDDAARAWETLSLASRRRIVDALWEVTILPASRGRRPGGGYVDWDAIQVRPASSGSS